MAHKLTRGAARLGAMATAALLTAGLGALPAQANETPFTVLAPTARTVLPQSDGGAAADYRTVSPVVVSEGESRLTGVKVAVDGSSLVGIAEFRLPSQCSWTDQAKLKASCSLGTVPFGDPAGLDLGIRSAAGAAAGAKGKVVFSYTASNGVEDTFSPDDLTTTAVTVGDGADLTVGHLGDLTMSPTGSSSLSPVVTNRGSQAAKGVVLYLDTHGAFAVDGNYSNCVYNLYWTPLGQDPGSPGTGAICTFADANVAPGASLALSAPVVVDAVNGAGSGSVTYGFDTVGSPLAVDNSTGRKGTGAALTLVQAAKAGIDGGSNLAVSTVQTGLVDDLAVTAHNVSTTTGKTASVSFTVKNVGTAPTKSVYPGTPGASTALLYLQFPTGSALAAGLPVGCKPGQGVEDDHVLETLVQKGLQQAGDGMGVITDQAEPVVCSFGDVLKPGQSATIAFQVRSAAVLKNAGGGVLVIGQDDDANFTDNAAHFTVNVAKAGSAPASPSSTASGSGSATATANVTASAIGSANASASPTGLSGSLANTGGGSDALPLLGGGTVALVVGVGAVLMARRRRTGGHS